MQARRDAKAARVAQREAHIKANYKKAKVDWYSFRGTSGCGYRAIAKNYKIPIARMRRLVQNEHQEGLDDSSSDDDDSVDYDSY